MFKFPVIDSHIHMYSKENLAIIEAAAQAGDYSGYTLLSGSFMPRTAPGNLSVAWAKLKHPGRVYGYASLHAEMEGTPDAQDLLKQARQYHRIGFDGIKMLDGKPSARKNRAALDDACYDPLFSYLEENQIPVLYHSNDPIEFWDINRIPAWAKDIFFYDQDNPTKDQITKETVGILKKHPGLKLTVAHFFFLPNTGEYDLACELMETYPNFSMDLTPGWEMFGDMHRDPERWKQYVVKYSDRLMYGTDMNGSESDTGRLGPLRRALETEDEFTVEEYTCYGLGLDDVTLKNIYADTYRNRIQKGGPKPIDLEALAAYRQELEERLGNYRSIDRESAHRDAQEFWSLIEDCAGK